MRHIAILLLTFLTTTFSFAQVFEPTAWRFSHEETAQGEYTLQFDVAIEEGWYVYSQTVGADEDGIGPVATSFTFEELGSAELVGIVEETGKKTKDGLDPVWGFEVKKFGQLATFRQKVKAEGNTTVKGYLEFMVCNDERCLPPEFVDFTFELGGSSGSISSEESSDINTIGDIGGQQEGFLRPVKWSIALDKTDDKTATFSFTAKIDEGWYVYSQTVGADEDGIGPVATSFTFESLDTIQQQGLAEEISKYTSQKMDPVWGFEVKKFKKEVTFKKLVSIKPGDEEIKGYFEFMTCDDERCLPPEYIDFEANLTTGEATITTPQGDDNGSIVSNDEDGCYGEWGCPTSCGAEQEEPEKGLLGIFFLGFIGGLLALLTPCVFPMIPLTVSFFTKGGKDRKAGLAKAGFYGFSIVLIYFLLSVPFFLFNISPDVLNEVSTSVWLNVVFFLVFLIFAFSFFGYYEITLPSSIANKADSASDVGGALGIFFMAVTLAIVSFSCTGPILGSLLVGTLNSEGGNIALSVGMVGFGIALALPFTVFAAFPQYLQSLPKSGGWLNQVKVVLGFAEIALAIKFLSNADLVDHWGIIKIEVFLGIWIVCSLGIAAYLLGLIRFPHDSKGEKPGKFAIAVAIIAIGFTGYLASGFMYNEKTGTFRTLTLLSGLAPSAGYSFIHPSKCPQNLECFKTLEEGLAFAKKKNKPVMFDFTGYACVNCRKMEESVWPDQDILAMLKEDYVVISLYVDDKEMLPEEEQYISEATDKKVRTIGNRNTDFQISNFKNNSQPFYVLVTPDEKMLTLPVGYTPNEKEYADFLRCGLSNFKGSKLASK